MRDILQVIEGFHKRATFEDEAAVKRVVRRVLNHYNVFNYMPPSNAYGKSGISDIMAIGNGRTVAIETKYGYNKPTAMQLEFGQSIEKAGGLFLVVNERNFVLQMQRAVAFIDSGEDPDENPDRV